MSLSAPSLALVQHLRKRGAQTVDAILASHATEPRAALYRRLGNLEANGWVERRTQGELRVWAARADVPQRLRAQAKTAAASKPKAAPAGVADLEPLATPRQVAAPRQVDVMHGAIYRPMTTFVARPGALDAARIASHGTRC